ncbi:hypothetical protein AA12467_1125 [Gluconobacter sphaericus NBRC 12467]|nr:hypothetical protein AA12467_1125 [Gluconobacter sphaericus NBRC 12467]
MQQDAFVTIDIADGAGAGRGTAQPRIEGEDARFLGQSAHVHDIRTDRSFQNWKLTAEAIETKGYGTIFGHVVDNPPEM